SSSQGRRRPPWSPATTRRAPARRPVTPWQGRPSRAPILGLCRHTVNIAPRSGAPSRLLGAYPVEAPHRKSPETRGATHRGAPLRGASTPRRPAQAGRLVRPAAPARPAKPERLQTQLLVATCLQTQRLVTTFRSV